MWVLSGHNTLHPSKTKHIHMGKILKTHHYIVRTNINITKDCVSIGFPAYVQIITLLKTAVVSVSQPREVSMLTHSKAKVQNIIRKHNKDN